MNDVRKCDQCDEPTDEVIVVWSPGGRARCIEVCVSCSESLCDDHGWRAA